MYSIKKNFFFSSLLTVSNYIFPIIVFPYVSRVLGVEKIGVCNFIDGLINYFLLFAALGINTIGIREIARVKENKYQLKLAFSSLFVLNLISTLIVLTVYVLAIYFVPKLYIYRQLLFIGILKIISNLFLIEWFYKGMEEFKYITSRSIFVKLIYVVAIYLFVNKPSDYNLYFLLTTGVFTINGVINCWYNRTLFFFDLKKIQFKKFTKPFFVLGGYLILTSMYTTFNLVYLGFVTNSIQVGYYSTATKLFAILLAFYTAFTGVMLPRMSALLAEEKLEEFKLLITKSLDLLVAFSLPLIILCEIFAPSIIYLLSGSGYEGAILPMRIIVPLIFIIGYEQILVLQILLPLKKDRSILTNSLIGAVVGILLNIVLVSTYKSIGSSAIWIICEIVILVASQYSVWKFVKIGFPYHNLLKNILYGIPIAIFLYCLQSSSWFNIYLELSIASVLLFVYYFILEYFIKKNVVLIILVKKVRGVF